MSIASHIRTCFVDLSQPFVDDRLNTRNVNDLLLASLPSYRLEVSLLSTLGNIKTD